MASSNKDSSPDSLFPRRVFTVSDYEVSNDVLKFFILKGLFWKKQVLVKEIPVHEIDSVESYWNELSVTWNGVTNIFFKKNSFESFSDLRDKLRGMLKEYQETLESNERASLIKKDLIGIIPIVDGCFDILMSLREKGVSWLSVKKYYYNNLSRNCNLKNEILPSIVLDFSELSEAIDKELPRKVAKEIHSILEIIHDYFYGFSSQIVEFPEGHPNFQDMISFVDSYYTLNDILFGKVLGEVENPRENEYLEGLLKKLFDETNFKVNFDELKTCFSALSSEDDSEGIIADARGIFREKLSELK